MSKRSQKYIEKLFSFEPVYLFNDDDLTRYMLYKGRVGSSKVIDEVAKIRAVYENDIEVEINDLRLTYTEYAKVLVYDIMDCLGIKSFKNLSNDIYSVQPLFAKTGIYYDMVYVDISDAYYTIYSRYFYVQYRRGSYITAPIEIPELNVSKRVKRSIYGVMRSNLLMRYERKGEKIEYMHKKVYSPSYNPDLINLINDILHVVAYRAINDFEAVYYNTDGAIIPRGMLLSYLDFLHSLGFSAKVKFEGYEIEIRGVGAYRFDSIKSGTFDRIVKARNFNNILQEDIVKWLENKIKVNKIKTCKNYRGVKDRVVSGVL